MADNSKNSKKTTKRRTTHRESVDIVKVCAFWGIFLAAALFIASGILNLINVSFTIISILDLIAKLALLVAVAFPAYSYVRGRGKVWKIISWVAMIIYILGCVFSVIRL